LVPPLGPYYRITCNVVVTVHITAVWFVGDFVFSGLSPLAISASIKTALSGLSILGVVLLVTVLCGYDLGRLAGTAQIRSHRQGINEPEDEPLRLTGFHAYVRHPVYTGAYLILWGWRSGSFRPSDCRLGFCLLGCWDDV